MNKTGVDYNNKILKVRNLKRYFKVGTGKTKIKVKAVDDISFDVHKREVFGLVGESGCGKTTASRTIMRLYRPTDGTITLDDQIIGSGHNEFYKNMKYERIKYKLELSKTNSRKNAILEVKSKYKNDLKKIAKQIEKIESEYDEKELQIQETIENYKVELFQKKNEYRLKQEESLFDFTLKVDLLYKMTINEFEVEYNDIKKSIINGYKSKVEAIKYSQGLNNEAKEQHREMLKIEHEENLAELDARLLDKINDKSGKLLPKSEYKEKVKEYKVIYKEEIKKNELEYNNIINSITKPDYVGIRQKLAELKQQRKEEVSKVKLEYNEILAKQKEEINNLPKKAIIDYEKRKKLKEDYKNFLIEQRAGIKKSKRLHYEKETEIKTREMQMIFQDPISSLNPRMTVGEIISEGLVIKGEKDKELINKRVIEVLELVGLAPEYISRYPHEFSGGQRQRIGIARAIIMNPSFIIADEPISALDVSIRAQVLNLLTELKEKLDLSILFIAHDLSVVKFFCDRIAVMYAGKIIEMSSSEEIFNNPIHPYTKSLLSAVPQPDPDSEKKRKRITYSPTMHDYRVDKPEMHEVKEGHFVYCNQKELELIKKDMGDINA